MAAVSSVLEKRDGRSYMDDTIPLTASISTYRTMSSHVEFVIRVQRGPNPADSWDVSHRYSNFDLLHQALQVSRLPLPLPPKKVFGTSERQFLVERMQGLQAFLDAVLKEPLLAASVEVKKFLDPTNYSENFYENALRNVSMFFRSEPKWAVVEPLRGIGWRFRKQYYLIASKTDPKLPRHLLSWCEPGPDSSLGDRELDAAMKVLTEIRHPFILSPVSASYNGTGVMVVRRFNPSGSLRDLIYGVKPSGPVLVKYSQQARRLLQLSDVRIYGRQVLEAMSFLLEKGFVLGHIHAGNVIIEGGCCRLVDIENSLLGLPSLYRHQFIEIRKIHSHIGEAVYSFGHMLYEMCFGHQLKTATIDVLSHAPAPVVPILESILTLQGIKNGLPSITDLLANSFFSEVNVAMGERPTIRVPSKLKEVLRTHLEHVEQRVHDQQRKLVLMRRESRAKENLQSEEERKKRRKKARKQMSLQETAEPQAYPVTTSLPRQNTIASSQPVSMPSSAKTGSSSSSSSKTKDKAPSVKTNSKATPPPTASPPPAAAAPAAPRPPTSGKERGALLSSIHTFSKGKLKKTVTKDCSTPSFR